MSLIISSLKINKDRFREEIEGSFMLATDLADYLVKKGLPFRESHHVLGKIVKFASENKLKLNGIKIEKYKEFSPLFDEDILDLLSAEKCLYNKKTAGSPNPKFVSASIKKWKILLDK
jgi:argininosuccinate lyase